MKGWISVKEKLPDISHGIMSNKVIIAMGVNDRQILFGWYRKLFCEGKGKWVTADLKPFARQELITHWMPVPAHPQQEL